MAEKKSKAETVTLVHETDRGDGTLTVDDRAYPVAGGVVHVAADDVEAAYQAGFRPASE